MAKLSIRVDPNLCITAANCVGVAPNLFQINDEGFAEVIDPATGTSAYEKTIEVSAEDREALEEAAISCPTRAILVSVAGQNGQTD
jgi:ferredoxin